MNYVELLGSREVSRGQGSYTASRTFLVYRDGSSFLSLEDAVNYEFGVTFSDTHPDIPSIFANGFSIKSHSERANTWELTWSYAQPVESTDAGGDDDQHDNSGDNTGTDPDDDGGVFDPPDGGGGDGGGGGGGDGGGGEQGDDGTSEDEGGDGDTEERTFNGVSITTGLALVDGYVAEASVPTNGAQGGDDGYLITNGTIVHQGGEPVTVPVPTTDITLSETQFGEYFDLNDVQLKAGKRNDASFYGFASGSVIFKGMSVQRQAYDMWDVSYNFVWDAWKHMRQIPERDRNGDLVWSDAVTPVLNIYYKQPFPETTSFGFAP